MRRVRTGDLAEYGITRRQLQHWQKRGLLAPIRSKGDQARYTPSDVRRARIVLACRRAKLRGGVLKRTVDEVSLVLEAIVAESISRRLHAP